MLPCRVTTAPPAGAGEVSLTVPVTVLPEGTDDWLKVRDERLGGGVGLPAGVKVIQVCGARYPSISVPVSITTRIGAETALVGMLKSVPVAPAGIKTVAGVLTRFKSLLTSLTVVPPVGAGLCKVMLPATEVPPTTLSLPRLVP